MRISKRLVSPSRTRCTTSSSGSPVPGEGTNGTREVVVMRAPQANRMPSCRIRTPGLQAQHAVVVVGHAGKVGSAPVVETWRMLQKAAQRGGAVARSRPIGQSGKGHEGDERALQSGYHHLRDATFPP